MQNARPVRCGHLLVAAALLAIAARPSHAEPQPRPPAGPGDTVTVAADEAILHARCDPFSPTRAILQRGAAVVIEQVVDGWVNVRVPESNERGCLRRVQLEGRVAAPLQPRAPRAGQTGRRTPASPAAHARSTRVSGFGYGGQLALAASRSFDAILGRSTGAVWGGGAQVVLLEGLLRNVFVQVDGSQFRGSGERVFVHDGEVFRLGIPTTIRITPIELTAGYRLQMARRPRAPRPPSQPPGQPPPKRTGAGDGLMTRSSQPTPSRASETRPFPVVPYGGGGVGRTRYQERSQFAEGDEDVDESFTSYHVLGGIEVAVWRAIGVGVEGHYRWVPDALGTAGVADEFNETNLGGATVRLKVVFSF